MISLFVAVLLCIGCAHTADDCQSPDLSGLDSHPVPDLDQLRTLILEVLDAHCRCVFPDSLAHQLTFGGELKRDPRTLREVFDGEPRCLGRLRVRAVQFEPAGNMVVFDLERTSWWARLADGDYHIIAVESDGVWYYYWPARNVDAIH